MKEFLWADYRKGVWDGDDLSNLLKTSSVRSMRPLGIREYRQVATAFMEQHLRYKVDDGQEEENIFNLQAGHGGRTTNLRYAVATGDSRIITRSAMHQFFIASGKWSALLRNRSTGVEVPMNGKITVLTLY